ncbi:hypothetical protein GGR56DRAFT_631634 [Xylariaceae sp. FL0804]|nr:hypothetical protein GGR56DRAFT_631634 [Xylariaceae sp. FL0804]
MHCLPQRFLPSTTTSTSRHTDKWLAHMASSPLWEQLVEHCAQAASTLCDECTIILSKDKSDEASSLAGCEPALIELLSRQAEIVSNCYQTAVDSGIPAPVPPEKRALVAKRLRDIASIAYAKFYAFLYKDLPVCWRQLYTDASILRFCFALLWWTPPSLLRQPELRRKDSAKDEQPGGPGDDEGLDELVKTLDLAIILAGAAGQTRGRAWIDKALELLRLVWLDSAAAEESRTPKASPPEERPSKRARTGRSADIPAGSRVQGDDDDDYWGGRPFSTAEPFTPPVTHPVRRVDALSMEEFQEYLDRPRDAQLGPEPLVLRGALGDWPALSSRPWSRPAYLLAQTFGGRRLVPVEVGRSYVDAGWGQRILPFGDFLREYIGYNPSSSSSSSPSGGGGAPAVVRPTTAYLAQHPLLAQLPALRADIRVPDYCYTSPPPPPPPSPVVPELDEPLLNAWLGPAGTVTPSHTDPYHNVLAQVVGRKYVRLHAPREGARMAARSGEGGVDMSNTSQLDVGVLEGWDEDPAAAADDDDDDENDAETEEGKAAEKAAEKARAIAAFRAAPFVDCILEPGDALYIPVGWWHYVRGLSVSFSVSFWWN